MKGERKEVRKDLPKKFYKEADGTGYPVLAYTVGELKKVLSELPDDIPIHQDHEIGVHVVVYNAAYEDISLCFEENEYGDNDEYEEYDDDE